MWQGITGKLFGSEQGKVLLSCCMKHIPAYQHVLHFIN